MFCTNCGAERASDYNYCYNCGARLVQGQAVQPGIATRGTVVNAGFWMRFGAFVIDSIPLGIISWILAYFFVNTFLTTTSDTETSFGLFDAVKMWIFYLVLIILYWPYFAIMESSSKQATLGKMALGIIVTDSKGNKITFWRATGRFFMKAVSGLLFLPIFIVTAFTPEKQALHDIIAGCLVVKKLY